MLATRWLSWVSQQLFNIWMQQSLFVACAVSAQSKAKWIKAQPAFWLFRMYFARVKNGLLLIKLEQQASLFY